MSNGKGIASNPAALKRLRRRYREEGRFRAYGLAAIAFAILSLAVLLISIVGESVSAFTKHEISVDVMIDPAVIDPTGKRDPVVLSKNVSAFSDLVRDNLKHRFPDAAENRDLRRQLNRMVSTLAGTDLAKRVAANPGMVGQTTKVAVPVSDLIDLYLKGLITDEKIVKGGVEATVSRVGGEVTVRAPGGFASVYEDLADRLRTEAKARSDAAEVSQQAIERTNVRIEELRVRREELARADAARIVSEAETDMATGDEHDVALARAAGAGDVNALRTAVEARLREDAATANKEADELLSKGASYAKKAVEAEASGEPTAETRRIQAETAYLAGDKRRVDAKLLVERADAVKSTLPNLLVSETALTVGRPLASLGMLAEAVSPAAVASVNLQEIEAAKALVRDQERRIALLTAEVGALKPIADARATSLEATAIPQAQSRLARLNRDLETLIATSLRLQSITTGMPYDPAPADDAAPVVPAEPFDPIAFVEAERQAQLGLDLGGPIAAAFALGKKDDVALKALMVAHADLDLAGAQRDAERLTRKKDRDTQLANGVLSRLSSPGVPVTPDQFSPSLLVEINGGVVKALTISPDEIAGEMLIPLTSDSTAASGAWQVRELEVAEADRMVSDRQAAWANALRDSGEIKSVINFDLITKADSTYPELAGLAAALAGSFWIMLVTLALSLPIGVAAAIYLEEFAPRNRITDFIEVNINNLAAVPSIVFGLLGAAVFINFFDLPRSAPLVGGLVLSLITLPTIIIATRAALGAVPPSIREGALAVGASLPQTVFHHVLPLAAPGVLTGAIIGLARALGETAPLLLIGMVAFVADPPDGPLDSATALPVLVYKWSSAAERAWQPMTSAAIIVLLVFMFAMNALAVYLRRRLERRW